MKGDIIDIFPTHYEDPPGVSPSSATRSRLFEFDPLTGKKTTALPQIKVYAHSHNVTPRPTLIQAVDNIQDELQQTIATFKEQGKLLEAQRIEQRVQFDLEMLQATGSCNGIENYSRYLTGRKPGEPPPTLFEYLPENAIVFTDESHQTIPQLGAMYRGDFSRKRTLAEYGFRLPSCMETASPGNGTPCARRPSTSRPLPVGDGAHRRRLLRTGDPPTGLIDPPVEVAVSTGTTNQVDDVIAECKDTAERGYRSLVTTLTKKMARPPNT